MWLCLLSVLEDSIPWYQCCLFRREYQSILYHETYHVIMCKIPCMVITMWYYLNWLVVLFFKITFCSLSRLIILNFVSKRSCWNIKTLSNIWHDHHGISRKWLKCSTTSGKQPATAHSNDYAILVSRKWKFEILCGTWPIVVALVIMQIDCKLGWNYQNN